MDSAEAREPPEQIDAEHNIPNSSRPLLYSESQPSTADTVATAIQADGILEPKEKSKHGGVQQRESFEKAPSEIAPKERVGAVQEQGANAVHAINDRSFHGEGERQVKESGTSQT